MEINKDILRWVLLLGAMPIWWPFLRMLWRDFNRALAEEGGVFGKAPTAEEAERIRREKLSDPEILISEPWARRGERQALRTPASGPGRAGSNREDGGAQPRRPGSAGGAPGFRSTPTKPGSSGERGGGFR